MQKSWACSLACRRLGHAMQGAYKRSNYTKSTLRDLCCQWNKHKNLQKESTITITCQLRFRPFRWRVLPWPKFRTLSDSECSLNSLAPYIKRHCNQISNHLSVTSATKALFPSSRAAAKPKLLSPTIATEKQQMLNRVSQRFGMLSREVCTRQRKHRLSETLYSSTELRATRVMRC